jgi:hypothetical protein
MQKKLFLEHVIEGTTSEGTKTLEIMCKMMDFFQLMIDKDNDGYGLSISNSDMLKEVDGVPVEPILEHMNKDRILRGSLTMLKSYLSDGQYKNYVLTRPLTDCLKRTKLTPQSKFLPEDMKAYIEVPDLVDDDGEEIKCVLIISSLKFLNITAVTYNGELKGHNFHYHRIPLGDRTSTLDELVTGLDREDYGKELLGKTREEAMKIVMSSEPTTTVTEQVGIESWVRVVVNAVLYINHNPELKEEINTFSTRRSKREWEKRQYTARPFILVGRNFEVTRVLTNMDISVRSHPKWQHYGPKNAHLKLIVRDGYTYKRKGTEDA